RKRRGKRGAQGKKPPALAERRLSPRVLPRDPPHLAACPLRGARPGAAFQALRPDSGGNTANAVPGPRIRQSAAVCLELFRSEERRQPGFAAPDPKLVGGHEPARRLGPRAQLDLG